LVDVLLPSYPADAALVAGEALEPEGALRRFAAAVPFVAIKAGAAGAWLSAHGTRTHLPAVPTERVVDTTGAGDAWNGAFLHFLLAGERLGKAARLANQVAAAKLAYRGAVPSADFVTTLSGNTVPRCQV
jgi:2-dehydro-3-deoxygluconokinase